MNNFFTLKHDFYSSQVNTSTCSEGTISLIFFWQRKSTEVSSIKCVFLHSVLGIKKCAWQ